MTTRWIGTILGIFMISFWLMGCASHTALKSSAAPGSITKRSLQKAKEHYFNAALYDFQEQYDRALLEYFQALTFDSLSPHIHKAIGRDFLRTRRFESAIPYLQKAVRLNPEDKEALYYLGEAYFNLKQYQLAIRYFEQFFAIDPYNPSVVNNLEYLYTQTRDTTRLIQLLEKELTLFGYEEETVIQLYSIYLERQNFTRAHTLVQKLLAHDPNRSTNYLLLGNLYELEKDTSRAVAAYQKALSLDPRRHEILVRLFRFYRQTGKWDLFIQELNRLLTQDPADMRKILLLGEAYLNAQRFAAVDSLLQPYRENPQFKEQVYELLARAAVGAQKFSKAESYLRTLVQLNPKNKFGWVYLTLIYNQQNRLQDALRTLQIAMTHFKDDPLLTSMYGSTLVQAERYKEARQILEKAYRENPENRDIIVSLGIVYDQLKQYTQLDSLYSIALQKFPDDPLLLNNYSYSLAERGIRLKEALQMARKALKQDSTNGAYLDTVGWIYFKMGDYPTALEYLLKAVEHRENSAEVLGHIAEVYLKLGQPQKAREYFLKALELEPQNTQLQERLKQLQ